jgi:hypothetical protein
MSVFVVKLQNLVQGRLDLDPSTDPLAAGTTATYGDLGTPFATSKQRQIYVAGPHRTYRLLKDGETFTDCNYWKQYTIEGGCEPMRAFLHLHEDDGTVWSDDPVENTYGVGGAVSLTTDLAANVITFVTTYGAPARFLQVQNLSGAETVTGELNGDTALTFTIGVNGTHTFNVGELAITKLRLKSSGSSSASWLASIKTAPTS